MIKINEKAPRKLGLYIHIPFCRTKCLYCDFCSFVSRDEAQRGAYVDALIREIGARGTKDYSVDTVYFGGGTPSILRAEQIERVLNAVRESFALCEDVEITLECNPSTVGPEERTANGRPYGVGDESLGRDVEGAVPYGVGGELLERDVEGAVPYGVGDEPLERDVEGAVPYGVGDESLERDVEGAVPYGVGDEPLGRDVEGAVPYGVGDEPLERDVEGAVPYGVGDESLGRDVEGAVPYGVGGYFAELRKLGVNRLSVGIQSAVDKELKLIGRRHTFDGAKQTFYAARRAGFENISVDLMFGIPSQTLESLEYSLGEFIALGAEHISIYSLQLEEGTPLCRMQDRYAIPGDDLVADMYEKVVSRMKNAGYVHYEISNFSKEGRESRHNSKYWSLGEYLGLGLAAHSDFDGKRLENTRNMDKYLRGERMESELEISSREREFEFLMLGLRTARGISKAEFFERFGVDFDEKYGEKVKNLEGLGYFSQNGQNLAFNERGFEVSNMILAQILDFDY